MVHYRQGLEKVKPCIFHLNDIDLLQTKNFLWLSLQRSNNQFHPG